MRRAIDWGAVEDARPAVVTAARTWTWGALRALAATQTARHADCRGRRVGVVLPATGAAVALLSALDDLAADVFLIAADTDDGAAAALGRALGLAAVLRPADDDAFAPIAGVDGDLALAGGGDGAVTILTSGTTGAPKAARHGWATLARPVRRGGGAGTWLLSYRPHLYAGLQVLLQALVPGGTLVVPGRDAHEVARLAAAHGVQFASATPSWWRWLLLFAEPAELARLELRQITLGGEAVDQEILDRLAARFPGTRLVHVDATTELGRCFSVTDGRAGFPRRFLDAPSTDGVELAVRDGELFVRSANAMRAYDPRSAPSSASPGADGFVPTGDLVSVAGDRCLFIGRAAELLNVGGNKVQPLAVEQVVLGVPGVADVRVYGKRSSLVGQLVACDVVLAAGAARETALAAITARCVERLQPHERPRFLQVVPRIELTAAGKKTRNGADPGPSRP